MRKKFLIAYDISHPRRLQRVAKVMLDYGPRLQKSVFEAELTPRLLHELRQRVLREIEPDEDGVKFYPLCRACEHPWLLLGQQEFHSQLEPYSII